MQEELIRVQPGVAEFESTLGEIFSSLGQVRFDQGRHPEALTAYRHGLDWHRQAVAAAPLLAEKRKRLNRCYEAAAGVMEGRQAWPGDAGGLYEAARGLALCLDKDDRTPAGPTDPRRRIADQALQALRECLLRTPERARALAGDKDLDSLREYDEYRKMAQDFQPKSTGQAGK